MPAPKVYLSSTLKDLEAERTAIKDVLGSHVAVAHSYRAGENDLIAHCLKDVDSCDVFVLVLGMRYGYVPTAGFDNSKGLSITELEYERALGKPRFVFVKSEDAIPVKLTDLRTNEHPADRIDTFRARVQNGADQTAALFSTINELREAALNAIGPVVARLEREGDGARPHDRASHEATRAGYVEWLAEECERIVLLGLGARDRQNVRLGQVYVPALTNWAQEERKASGPAHEPLLHRLGRESIYVPGAPGSGKSTFCRWVALSVASGDVPRQALPAPADSTETFPEAFRARFPLLCPLREWTADKPWLAGNGQWRRQQLETALAAWIDDTKPGGLTAVAFLDVLEKGNCLLILDGVDEIPERADRHYPRLNVLTGLADALKPWSKKGHRVMLTSRPYGVETATAGTLGLPAAELLGLSRELQALFVSRWFSAAGTKDAEQKASGLIAHLDDRRDLDELRPNPMLLTALCVKFDENLQLPGDFYRLYTAVTDQVLYKRYPTEPERDLARLRLSAVALRMHEGPKEHPRANPAPEVSIDEVDAALAELAQTDRTSERSGTDESEKREQLLSSSGLLLPRAGKRAGFYHLSFQEFLSALRLRRLSGDCRPILGRHMTAPQWRPTLRFLFCATADQSSPEHAFRDYSVLLDYLDQAHLSTDSGPALLLADCLEVAHAREWSLQDFARPFRQACELALRHVEPPARARLWEVLGRIGLDDRPGVGLKEGVPDIDWIDVPGGPFKFGEKKRQNDLPAFRIARYPVTNAQFKAFIDAGGFDDAAWWQWPERRTPPDRPWWTAPNHPRESVSWFDAMAFCRWLDVRLHERGELNASERVTLPTEQQWERAARGTDGWEYPWGNVYESGRANIDETMEQVGPHYLRQTSAVGIYLTGVSPFGALDMAGNVWEWCLDNFDPRKKGPDDSHVVRGGSWNDGRGFARASYRGGGRPGARDGLIGFRVVVVSPIK